MQQNNQQPRRRKQSLSEISAQDLLEKSHEELVLMLIHLRRQTTALTEAIEGSKAELGHMEKALSSYGGKSEVALMMLGSSGSNNSELFSHFTITFLKCRLFFKTGGVFSQSLFSSCHIR